MNQSVLRYTPSLASVVYLRQEAVDVGGLSLPEAEDPEDRLCIVRRVPRSVEDDDAVGAHQVRA